MPSGREHQEPTSHARIRAPCQGRGSSPIHTSVHTTLPTLPGSLSKDAQTTLPTLPLGGVSDTKNRYKNKDSPGVLFVMEENADSAAPPAPQELTAAGGDNGSFDDEHDEDMLPEEEQVEDTEEQPKAAATAAATASLSSEMSNTELQQWMAGYRDQAGNTIFLAGSARSSTSRSRASLGIVRTTMPGRTSRCSCSTATARPHRPHGYGMLITSVGFRRLHGNGLRYVLRHHICCTHSSLATRREECFLMARTVTSIVTRM